jgi:hypothetical protein
MRRWQGAPINFFYLTKSVVVCRAALLQAPGFLNGCYVMHQIQCGMGSSATATIVVRNDGVVTPNATNLRVAVALQEAQRWY